MNSTFSAVFVGAGTLLLECAELFIKGGHKIKCVATDDKQITQWAVQRSLPWLPTVEWLRSAAASPTQFDLLFSIVNLYLIPSTILTQARYMAINYHDGPLPEYAGMNTPSWAILNGERSHGITWHAMTNKTDAGPILKKVSFPIEPTETALTLNAKCFEAALKSFNNLLTELSGHGVIAERQDLSLRSHFSRYRRPPAACSIVWNATADQISALTRSLDFGPYVNPIGIPKFWVKDTSLLTRKAKTAGSNSGLAPGTVLDINDTYIRLSTQRDDIYLFEISTIMGRKITANELVSCFSINVGDVLPCVASFELKTLTELDCQLASKEPYWSESLREFQPLQLPYRRHLKENSSQGVRRKKLRIPAKIVGRPDKGSAEDWLAAALTLFFTRVAGSSIASVAVHRAGIWNLAGRADALYSAYIPISVEVNPLSSFADFVSTFQMKVDEAKKNGTFLLDLLLRDPQLTGCGFYGPDRSVPVAIEYESSSIHSLFTSADLAVRVSKNGQSCTWTYRPAFFDTIAIQRLQKHFLDFVTAANSSLPISQLSILSSSDRALLAAWNNTTSDLPDEQCIHGITAMQASRTPDRIAIIAGKKSLNYRQLDERANALAHFMISKGVRRGSLIGVLLDRSISLPVALLAILKSGGAYVPLDPDYPTERLAFMISDANVQQVLTVTVYEPKIARLNVPRIYLDEIEGDLANMPSTDPVIVTDKCDLAYVIYTSGSTGQPKGVMVEHRNVLNLFSGMDSYIDSDPPGVWLAVTSISFDISVLELLWTLARGFTIVLYGRVEAVKRQPRCQKNRRIDFSLFYFAADESTEETTKYKMLLEGAKYADQNGFSAVWVPERHFHVFGGLYPNPSIVAAAIAVLTKNISIRAGSCVLPLHNPIRIAEEWSVVDNLAGGRVGLSFASGWQPNDFALAPGNYDSRHEKMYEGIETVRALWRGERRSFPGPKGIVELSTLPRPLQAELPVWITAAGNPETFRRAGATGAGVLTHLLGQSIEELERKVYLYREAWKSAGHGGNGHVTLMVHTFVSDDPLFVFSQVREPLKQYLRTATDLIKPHLSFFPAFKASEGSKSVDQAFEQLSSADLDALIELAFQRYYKTSGLFGSPDSCMPFVDSLVDVGIDEIACLLDFGINSEVVLAHLPHLSHLLHLANATGSDPSSEGAMAFLLTAYDITHLQCTPSLLSLLLRDESVCERLPRLRNLIVGGEPLPSSLAKKLRSIGVNKIINMYGPTETTVWSTAHVVQADENKGLIPIGRPISNTRLHVLGEALQPVPIGMPGELFIGGEGVSRGYLHRPDLTEQRFLEDPFGPPCARLYRTGDIVRWRPDGVLEFIGRVDNQIKLNGHRIELGEIESTLDMYPRVQRSVVRAIKSEKQGQELVAYLTSKSGGRIDFDEVRQFLRGSLPTVMIPSQFIQLDEFPLTPNGKIDYGKLPEPNMKLGNPGDDAEPRTNLEIAVARIWCDVLKLKKVGSRTNFWSCGGDSLSAINMVLEIEHHFGVQFPFHSVFEAPTVAELAIKLEALLSESPQGIAEAMI